MRSYLIIRTLSRTGKKEFDVFLVGAECKYSCSLKVDISAHKHNRMVIWVTD